MLTPALANASQMPRIYYARHMQPGVARYEDETILVDTDAIKQMLPSAIGKPVYIHHQDVNLENLKEEAAGYITEAFYNELDGWGWFKIIGIDDQLHKAVDRHWSVSNAYRPTRMGSGGTKNNCSYDREILGGEFTHLAIVPNPRYESACIMSPEKFKAYQEQKRKELDQFKNSKSGNAKGKNPMFKFFKNKREEISDVSEITGETLMEVNGTEMTVTEFANSLEAKNKKEKSTAVTTDGLAKILSKIVLEKQNAKKNEKEKEEDEEKENEDEKDEMKNKSVDCGGEKMNVGDMVNELLALRAEKKNAKAKKNESEEEREKEEDEEEGDAMENAKKSKGGDRKHFNDLKNARERKNTTIPNVIDTAAAQIQRGLQRYGSGK